MHDGCAIAYVTNPELFETRPVYAEVKYFDSIKTGVLTMNFGKKPNAELRTAHSKTTSICIILLLLRVSEKTGFK